MKYSESDASAYKELGVESTTYALGLLPTKELLGNLSGKVALDFGTGTGRTARFLKQLGAARVVAVDQDENMLKEATQEGGIEYKLVSAGRLPLDDQCVDVAFCASVFVEMGELSQIEAASKEIGRVLKPGSPFVVITTSPYSIGADFVSWHYDKQDDLKSGDKITCHIKGDQPFEIQDYYWTEDDHKRAFEAAGFDIEKVLLPTAEGEGWLDETSVAPEIIFFCRKSGSTTTQ